MAYADRAADGDSVEELVIQLFQDQDFEVVSVGGALNAARPAGVKEGKSPRWKSVAARDASQTLRLVRYLPDLLIVPPDRLGLDRAFMADAKLMTAPVLMPSARDKLYGGLGAEFIGEVERDAFDNYRRIAAMGSRVALFAVCSYHPSPVLCEWVQNIEVLRVAEESRNENSTGSGTPRTNIHLGSMRKLSQFMAEEFGLEVSSAQKEGLLRPFMLNTASYIKAPGKWKEKAHMAELVEAERQKLSALCKRELTIRWSDER